MRKTVVTVKVICEKDGGYVKFDTEGKVNLEMLKRFLYREDEINGEFAPIFEEFSAKTINLITNHILKSTRKEDNNYLV